MVVLSSTIGSIVPVISLVVVVSVVDSVVVLVAIGVVVVSIGLVVVSKVVVAVVVVVVSIDVVTWVVVEVSSGSGMNVVCSCVVDSFIVEVDVGSIVVGVLHEESHEHEHVQYAAFVIVLTPSDMAGRVVALHVVGTVNGGSHLHPQTQF